MAGMRDGDAGARSRLTVAPVPAPRDGLTEPWDRCVRVVRAAGAVISIDVRAPESPDLDAALDAAESVLYDAAKIFGGVSSSSNEVLELAAEVEQLTDGWFTARRSGNVAFDTGGLARGWGIDRAGRLLATRGFADHCIRSACDVAVGGRPADHRGWRIGIADPRRAGDLLGIVAAPAADAFAVATAAPLDRAQCSPDPRIRSATAIVLGATVAGPVLSLASGLATALVTAGPDAPALLEKWRHAGWSGAILIGTGDLIDPDRLIQRPVEPGPRGVGATALAPVSHPSEAKGSQAGGQARLSLLAGRPDPCF